MEFVVYLANTVLCAWALYWCMLRSGAKPQSPLTGLFAWRPDPGRSGSAAGSGPAAADVRRSEHR